MDGSGDIGKAVKLKLGRILTKPTTLLSISTEIPIFLLPNFIESPSISNSYFYFLSPTLIFTLKIKKRILDIQI